MKIFKILNRKKSNDNITKRFEFDLGIENFKLVEIKTKKNKLTTYIFKLEDNIKQKELFTIVKLLSDLGYTDNGHGIRIKDIHHTHETTLIIFSSDKTYNFDNTLLITKYSIMKRYFGDNIFTYSRYTNLWLDPTLLIPVHENTLPEYIKDYKLSFIDRIKLKRRLK